MYEPNNHKPKTYNRHTEKEIQALTLKKVIKTRESRRTREREQEKRKGTQNYKNNQKTTKWQ